MAEPDPKTKSYWLQSPRARIGKNECKFYGKNRTPEQLKKTDIMEEEARGPTVKCRERANLPAYFVVLDSSMDQKQ